VLQATGWGTVLNRLPRRYRQHHSDRNDGAAGGEIDRSDHLSVEKRDSVTSAAPNCAQILSFAMNAALRCAKSDLDPMRIGSSSVQTGRCMEGFGRVAVHGECDSRRQGCHQR
jgi:hypothetical protein